jgi:hypothetical protein
VHQRSFGMLERTSRRLHKPWAVCDLAEAQRKVIFEPTPERSDPSRTWCRRRGRSWRLHHGPPDKGHDRSWAITKAATAVAPVPMRWGVMSRPGGGGVGRLGAGSDPRCAWPTAYRNIARTAAITPNGIRDGSMADRPRLPAGGWNPTNPMVQHALAQARQPSDEA